MRHPTVKFTIHVNVETFPDGAVRTSRDVPDVYLDEVRKLPNEGLDVARFALLYEALRQESLLQALLMKTSHPNDPLDPEDLQFKLETQVEKFTRSVSQAVVSQTIDSVS